MIIHLLRRRDHVAVYDPATKQHCIHTWDSKCADSNDHSCDGLFSSSAVTGNMEILNFVQPYGMSVMRSEGSSLANGPLRKCWAFQVRMPVDRDCVDSHFERRSQRPIPAGGHGTAHDPRGGILGVEGEFPAGCRVRRVGVFCVGNRQG